MQNERNDSRVKNRDNKKPESFNKIRRKRYKQEAAQGKRRKKKK